MATDPETLNLNDSAVLFVDTGNFFTAPPGTPVPEDLSNIQAPWKAIGHTAIDEVFSVTSEGGEVTVLGTLQKPQLTSRTSPRTETFGLTLQQWDEAGLKLYYGSNAVRVNGGKWLGVPSSPQPTKVAFLAVFVVGGAGHFGFHADQSEIQRAEDIAIADTESLAGLPLAVKPMLYGSNKHPYAVTPMGEAIPAATTATAGEPGSFGPAGSAAPFDMAGLADVTANPSSAWAEGEYVVLGDGSEAQWDGSDWVEISAP